MRNSQQQEFCSPNIKCIQVFSKYKIHLFKVSFSCWLVSRTRFVILSPIALTGSSDRGLGSLGRRGGSECWIPDLGGCLGWAGKAITSYLWSHRGVASRSGGSSTEWTGSARSIPGTPTPGSTITGRIVASLSTTAAVATPYARATREAGPSVTAGGSSVSISWGVRWWWATGRVTGVTWWGTSIAAVVRVWTGIYRSTCTRTEQTLNLYWKHNNTTST